MPLKHTFLRHDLTSLRGHEHTPAAASRENEEGKKRGRGRENRVIGEGSKRRQDGGGRAHLSPVVLARQPLLHTAEDSISNSRPYINSCGTPATPAHKRGLQEPLLHTREDYNTNRRGIKLDPSRVRDRRVPFMVIELDTRCSSLSSLLPMLLAHLRHDSISFKLALLPALFGYVIVLVEVTLICLVTARSVRFVLFLCCKLHHYSVAVLAFRLLRLPSSQSARRRLR